ncbi:MAG: hypothetical protein JW863_18945 [Chitinispirillaceae bacterium]|nr:hypothetical protein [Chitinispirillaceae bacterium]
MIFRTATRTAAEPCRSCNLPSDNSTFMSLRLLCIPVFFLFWSLFSVSAAETEENDSLHETVVENVAEDTIIDLTVDSTIPNSLPDTGSTPAAGRPSQPSRQVTTATSQSDSLRKRQTRDSLLNLEQSRRHRYAPDSTVPERQSIDDGDMFRSDATSWINMPFVRRLNANPRIGVAGYNNRLLYMGNTVPLTKVYAGTRLLYETADDPLYGDDAWCSTEFSSISLGADGTRTMVPRTVSLATPESEFFWETGVFDENILLLRFTRPLSRHLQVNIFSNYRHFTGTAFSHEGNDVYTVFSSITSDTTLLSRRGYSPQVNEYFCGADARWQGTTTELYGRVKYGDLTSELPLNRTPANDYPDFTRVSQFPFSFTGGVTTHRGNHFFADAECRWLSHPQRRIRSEPVGSGFQTEIIRQLRKDLSGAVRTGVGFGRSDTLALVGRVRRSQLSVADSLEPVSFQYRPEAVWQHRFSSLESVLSLRAGADFHATDTAGVYAPVWNATFLASVKKYRCALFVEQELLHYAPPIDSLATAATLHDAYFRAGGQVERNWNLFHLLAGYQWCYGIDTAAVLRSWASRSIPYRQPQSVFVIAPEFGRWNGMGISSRLLLSDTRPFVKLQGALSLLVFPKLTNEAFDIRLECNYWSEREPTVFADLSDWNRPVVDVNFIATAHIKSFRLVYKIDNLLNHDFSYVPGYYAPGITFRWGFSWFIQR